MNYSDLSNSNAKEHLAYQGDLEAIAYYMSAKDHSFLKGLVEDFERYEKIYIETTVRH